MNELTLPIVGIAFDNDDSSKSNRRFELKLLDPGARLDLVPEPKNAFDRNAIAVFSPNAIQVGYLPADRAAWVGMRMEREGYVALFQGLSDHYGFVRIRFGGEAPTLPVPKAAAPANIIQDIDEQGEPRVIRQDIPDDFYPDTDGPEWGA